MNNKISSHQSYTHEHSREDKFYVEMNNLFDIYIAESVFQHVAAYHQTYISVKSYIGIWTAGKTSKPVRDTLLNLYIDFFSSLASKHREPDDIDIEN